MTDETMIHMMIDIMGIQYNPDYIGNLKEWISNEGIDVVFNKVIRMYSLDLSNS